MRVGEVTAVAWPDQMALATALAERADRTTEWPGLGRRDPGPLRLIVVADAARFIEVSGGRAPEWGAAVAVPGARTILLRADAGDLYRTLRHELAHLVLHDAVRARIPLWFDEGYATWAAGEFDRLDALALNLAVVRGAVPHLAELNQALRGSSSDVGPAYGLAATAVIELARRHPDGTLGPLLGRLARGEDFAASVVATTGLTPGQFDIEWRRAVRRRYGLLAWTVAGGLWLVVALAVLGLGRLRRRWDRARRAALDQDWTVPSQESNGQ